MLLQFRSMGQITHTQKFGHSPANRLIWCCRLCSLSLIAVQSTVGQWMAVWRRKPTNNVLIHSDQGTQFTSIEWASFLKHHNLEHSMSCQSQRKKGPDRGVKLGH